MTDIAHLGFVVDSSTAAKATSDLDRLGDQAVVTEKQVTGAAAKTTKGFNTMAAGARSAGAGMRSIDTRMISMQLSQVAQQASAGGGILRALAIQLPDIGLAFGTVGIAAGVVAGALLPVIASFIDLGGGAKDLETALEGVDEIAKGLAESLDLLELSPRELSERFRESATSVRELAVAQAELRVANANTELKNQIALLDGIVEGYTAAIDRGRYYELMLKKVAEEFHTNEEGARLLEAALRALRDAPDYDGQVAALIELTRLMDQLKIETTEIPPEIAKAVDETISYVTATEDAKAVALAVAEAAGMIATETAGAAGEAERLAGAFAAAINLQSRINTQSSKQYGGRGGDPRQFMPGGSQSSYTQSADYTSVEDLIERYTPKTQGGSKGRKGAAGGGGVSEVEKQIKAYESLAASLDPVIAAEQEFAEGQEILNEVLQANIISQEQYEHSLGLLTDRYNEAKGAGEDFGELNRMLKDSIMDMALNGVESLNSLAEAIRRAALEALLFGEGPLGGLLGGAGGGGLIGGFIDAIAPVKSAKGNVFSGGRVQAFANGGVVGGTTYFPMSGGKVGMMGEAGPEAIVPLARGSDGKLGVRGEPQRVEVVVSVDRRGNIQAVVDDRVVSGLSQYDRMQFPQSFNRVRRDQRRIG